MDLGDGIAIYAAAVATFMAGLRVFEWRHAHRAHVRVELRAGLLTMTDGTAPEAIFLKVHNTGDHPVRVDSVGLNLQDGSGRTAQHLQVMPGASVPGVVPPRDSGSTYYEVSKLDGIDPHRPLTGFATLSTGEHVTSKSRTLFASR